MGEARIANGAVAHCAWTEAQRDAVLAEAHRILEHPTFKSSKRCVELLNYLMDRALDGDHEGVKERTLGIEAFGRSLDYDTNTDPIVRRTANEIRKRLAQCYEGADRHFPVKIHLARGSYLLEFEFAPAAASEPIQPNQHEPRTDPVQLHPSGGPHLESKAKPWRRNWILGIAAVLLLSAGSLLLVHLNTIRSPEYRIWKPLLDSGDRITLCLSDLTPTGGGEDKVVSGGMASMLTTPQGGPVLVSHGTPQDSSFIDVHVAQTISTRLQEFKRQISLQPASALTFQELRQRPAILVGGTNNPWGLILLSKLRYTLQIDPVTQDKWIQDEQNPSIRNWKLDGKLKSTDTFDDYAVVTRVFNKETGQWILALSGLEAHGTEAAGELVADPAFARLVPSNVLSSGNFQIVLRASVIRGSAGPFEVLAVHTW